MALRSSHLKRDEVRVLQPQLGEALIVERYSSKHVKAGVLHPDDFTESQGSSVLPDRPAVASRTELTELRARVHRVAESPEAELVDDEASTERFRGL